MANSLNTITVNGVTYNSEAYASANAVTKTNNELDKNAFLTLLVTELQNQDPLDPQDNSEFVAQMVQFSTLEQMSNMSSALGDINTLVGNIDTSVLVGQLSGMIGKGLDWIETVETADDKGNPVSTTESFSGIITGVTVADGVTKVIAQTEDGKTYQVGVNNIAYVYELNDNSENPSDSGVATEEVVAEV